MEAISVRIEVAILSGAWFLTIIMLLYFVPKNKIREAWLIFLFKQFITWVTGLVVVQYRLIEYPVRLFSYANRASFTFEFFIYPSMCVIFNLHYPASKSQIRQFFYYVYFCTAITGLEVVLERYTELLKYIRWHWSITWITLLITFYMSRVFYLWFFQLPPDGNAIKNPGQLI